MEQQERNLKIQLLHEDKNKALSELYQIIFQESRNYNDFQWVIGDFFNSHVGSYIPEKVAKDILSEIKRINERADTNAPPINDEELEHDEEQWEDYFKSLPYDDEIRIEHDVKNMTFTFTLRIKDLIRDNLNEL